RTRHPRRVRAPPEHLCGHRGRRPRRRGGRPEASLMQALDPVLARWRVAAFVASGAMLAIAHAFQTFGGLASCSLCLRQREVYWVAGAVALAAMLIVRTSGGARWRAPANLILGLVFLVSAGVAAYHAGVEWKWWPGPTV